MSKLLQDLPAARKASEREQAKVKAENDIPRKSAQEASSCPSCGAPAKVEGGGRRWLVLCENNKKTLHSTCKAIGHTMFTKSAAIQVWNDMAKATGGTQ